MMTRGVCAHSDHHITAHYLSSSLFAISTHIKTNCLLYKWGIVTRQRVDCGCCSHGLTWSTVPPSSPLVTNSHSWWPQFFVIPTVNHYSFFMWLLLFVAFNALCLGFSFERVLLEADRGFPTGLVFYFAWFNQWGREKNNNFDCNVLRRVFYWRSLFESFDLGIKNERKMGRDVISW